ncbi:MAG: virulence factor [Chloroflexi bacterium]|nr:virulence factor [Chloroflexota bacterium]
MAHYQIMFWKEFPAQIKAYDATATVKVMLPERFSQAIDAAAMVAGSTESSAYLDGWDWGPEQERAGSPQMVAEAVAAELEQAYPPDKLAQMIRQHKP